jgi:hypothetical protein
LNNAEINWNDAEITALIVEVDDSSLSKNAVYVVTASWL